MHSHTMAITSAGPDGEDDEDDEGNQEAAGAEDEALAIPEYGGEDIDEDAGEDDYGSSDDGEDDRDDDSAFMRMQEVIEELQEKVNNIQETQLEEAIRKRLSKMEEDIKEVRERYPEGTSYKQIVGQMDEVLNDVMKLRTLMD